MAHYLRQLILTLWVLLLVVCATAVGSLRLESGELNRLITTLGPAVDANDQVLRAMRDAQSGLDGYELSGDRSMLQPYFGAEARTKTSLAALRATFEGGSGDDAEVGKLTGLTSRQRLATEQWWTYASGAEQALSRGERTDIVQGRALFSEFSEANAELREQLRTLRNNSRRAAHDTLVIGIAVSVAVTLVALIAAFVLGRRAVRTIAGPLIELRDILTRQHHGETEARANVEQRSTEMRSLAISFNALTDQNLGLLRTQESALSMNALSFVITRAMRVASNTQQALEILCVELGEGLGLDRVMASTFDAEDRIQFSAQWQVPDLPPLSELSADLHAHLTQLAGEVWLSEGFRVKDDFLAPGAASSERAQAFRHETGARGVIMAPIGLGEHVIGMIYCITVHQPRQWGEFEARLVQQVAGFAARAVVQSDHQAHQSEYVERLERLDQQKSDFVATVSHELRTPLTSITGYLELLQDGDAGEMTERQRGMLEVTSRNTARLRGLIEDLLVLNRIDNSGFSAERVGISVRELIIHAGQELSRQATREKLELVIDTGPELLMVQGDRAALGRAVLYVVSNAIKFSRPGGEVTIRCIKENESHRVLISCQDHGIGVPAPDLPMIFTRFFRASNARSQGFPGTGLGLSIAKQIIEDHGGELRLSSVEGKGTTVEIDLLLYEPQPTLEALGNGSHLDHVLDIRA